VRLARLVLAAVLAATTVVWAEVSARPPQALDLGRVLNTEAVERTVSLVNPGLATLHLHKVSLSPGLRVVSMSRSIEPGGEGALTVRFDPLRLRGHYEGEINIHTSDPEGPRVIDVLADVVAPIEFLPRAVFFVAAIRGQEGSASIEIANNEDEPLQIEMPALAHDHFTTQLQTLEPGRRYRLTLSMRHDAPPGRRRDTIALHTSSKAMPLIRIEANTLMHERVYTHPDAVDLGSIPLGVIMDSPDVLARLAQTVMVYQAGGRDFRISAATDVTGLSIRSTAGPQGDRHQIRLALDSREIKVGPIRGTLRIQTNDDQWRSIEIPITGAIVD
jgi:hypothetical protein